MARKTEFIGKGSKVNNTVSLERPIGYTISNCSRVIGIKSDLVNDDLSMVDTKKPKELPKVALMKERSILNILDGSDDRIVRCFGEYVSIENGKERYNIVMECSPGGTLADIINARRGTKIPEREASMYAYYLLKGIHRIHKLGYVHCDLKPANIFVFPKRKEDGTLLNTLKLADFRNAKRTIALGYMRYGPPGTAEYMSPESVFWDKYDPPTDIWSLGCILFEILCGESPYSGAKNLDEVLRNTASKEYMMKVPINFLSIEAIDFLKKCLARNPEKRPTANTLLKHPFIVDYDTKSWEYWENDDPTPLPKHIPDFPLQKGWKEIKLPENSFGKDYTKFFCQYESLLLPDGG